jgi:hypothetical protein
MDQLIILTKKLAFLQITLNLVEIKQIILYPQEEIVLHLRIALLVLEDKITLVLEDRITLALEDRITLVLEDKITLALEDKITLQEDKIILKIHKIKQIPQIHQSYQLLLRL